MCAKKVLIALTSFNDAFYADGSNTGVFLVEALHPFNEYISKGFEVDFVSETGEFGWDSHSLTETFLNGQDKKDYDNKESKFQIALKNIKKASDVNSEDYSVIFFSAGHGTLFDYPAARSLQKIALSIYSNGGVIAAVCHAPVVFAGLNDERTGENIAKGKSMTGFTDIGEQLMGVDQIMKNGGLKTVEEVYREIGAKYLAPIGPWDNFTIADGRIVTGVNPASAAATAERSIIALDNLS